MTETIEHTIEVKAGHVPDDFSGDREASHKFLHECNGRFTANPDGSYSSELMWRRMRSKYVTEQHRNMRKMIEKYGELATSLPEYRTFHYRAEHGLFLIATFGNQTKGTKGTT